MQDLAGRGLAPRSSAGSTRPVRTIHCRAFRGQLGEVMVEGCMGGVWCKPAQLGPAPVADGHDRKRAEQGQVQQGKRAKHGEACEQVAVSSESEKSQRPDRHHCQTGPPRKVALEIQIVAVADGTPKSGPFRGEEGGSFYLPLP